MRCKKYFLPFVHNVCNVLWSTITDKIVHVVEWYNFNFKWPLTMTFHLRVNYCIFITKVFEINQVSCVTHLLIHFRLSSLRSSIICEWLKHVWVNLFKLAHLNLAFWPINQGQNKTHVNWSTINWLFVYGFYLFHLIESY